MEIALRPTTKDDLDFVLAAQGDPEVAPLITARPRERHLEAIASRDERHLIVEAGGEAVGYALISGLESPHRCAEIRTFVITRPGEGIGRAALARIVDGLFERGLHRVWLDTLASNERAMRAYAAVGFRRDGEMREAWRHPDGSYESLLVLSILESEWEGVGALGL